MKTNNKHRANRWERESAKMLSLWVSQGKRKDIFWRTNSSGAKHTRTGELNHAGDIVAVDPEGSKVCDRFLVETKLLKAFDYAAIPSIRKWIGKEGVKAERLGKSLLMIIKGRAGNVFVLTDATGKDVKRYSLPVSDSEYMVFHKYTIYRLQKRAA